MKFYLCVFLLLISSSCGIKLVEKRFSIQEFLQSPISEKEESTEMHFGPEPDDQNEVEVQFIPKEETQSKGWWS